jgi:hypothetical protein
MICFAKAIAGQLSQETEIRIVPTQRWIHFPFGWWMNCSRM